MNKCPTCGRDIPTGSPEGLCPYCLLRGSTQAPGNGPDPIARDVNLLFGVFAVQLRMATPQQFVDTAAAWATDPSRPFPDRMVDAGILDAGQRDLVQQLVDKALEHTRGDAGKALETIGGEASISWMLSHSMLDEGPDVLRTQLGLPAGIEPISPDDAVSLRETPGRYTRTSEYARGGMGRILLVHDEYLNRDIALKELLPRHSGARTGKRTPMKQSGALVVRFLREAKLTGQLEHPSIVPVYELGQRTDGTLYYTMKLVRGETFAKRLNQAPSLAARLKLLPNFLDLCHAVAYAHSRLVIHRDLKPLNVMIGAFGETVVIDWGLAKVINQDDPYADDLRKSIAEFSDRDLEALDPTQTGQRLGTPAYMAPEQVRGKIDAIDTRSDVFSLGVMLYEILTGRLPFTGKTSGEMVKNVVEAEPQPILQSEPGAPPELVSICLKALSKDPAKRFQDASEIAAEIERFQTGALVQAYAYSFWDHCKRYYGQHRAALNTAAAAALILLATGLISYFNVVRARDDAIVAHDAEAEAREEAVAARDAEADARQAEAVARADAERTGYINQIRLAHSYMQQNNYPRAREILWATQPQYRNWEWGYLLNRAHQELFTIEGYQDFAISPDGKVFVGFYRSRPLGIFDTATGALIREIPLDSVALVYKLMFNPDGDRLLLRRDDGRAQVINFATGEVLQSFRPHEGGLNAIAYSPEGEWILTAGNDSAARLWDADTAQPIRLFSAPGTRVDDPRFASNGTRFIATADGSVVVWETATGEILFDTSRPEDGRFAFSPDGAEVAVAGDAVVEIWNVDTSKLVRTLDDPHWEIKSVAYSSAGDRLLIAGNEGKIDVWDRATAEILASVYTSSTIVDAAWSPDSQLILTSAFQGSPQVRDAQNLELVKRLGRHHSPVIPRLAFSPDSQQIITGGGDNALKIWNSRLSASQSIAVAGPAPIVDLSLDAGRERLAVLDSRNTVSVIDWSQDQVVSEFSGFGLFGGEGVELSPDANSVIAVFDSFVPIAFDAAAGRVVSAYRGHMSRISACDIAPSNDRIATASWDGSIHIWVPESGEQDLAIDHPAEPVSVAFQPNGSALLVGDAEGVVALYDASSGVQLWTTELHSSAIETVRWVANGTMLAVASHGGAISIIDAATGRALQIFEGHRESPGSLEFFTDAQRLISASGDGVRVWDVPSGEEILTLNDPGETASQLIFLNERQALSRREDETWIRLWEPAPWSEIAQDPDPNARFAVYRAERLRNPRPMVRTGMIASLNIVASRERLLSVLARLRDALVAEAGRPADVRPDDSAGLRIVSGSRRDAVARIALRDGDQITEINSALITSSNTAVQALEALLAALEGDPSTQVVLRIRRDGADKPVTFRFVEFVEETREVPLTRTEATNIFRRFAEGLRQTDYAGSQDAAAQLGEPAAAENTISGVLVVSSDLAVDRDRFRAAQISPGDRITALNAEAVTGIAQFQREIEGIADALETGGSPRIEFDVERGEFQRIRLVFNVT